MTPAGGGLADPDSNRITLVPRGAGGVVGIAIDLVVRNRDAHDHFWRHVMQFRHLGPGIDGLGDSVLCSVGEAEAPRVLGDTLRLSVVQDPDGHCIALSGRASLVGGHL